MNNNNYYIISSRKYRPLHFEDVIGQNFITNTLKNAIQNDNLAHALLFSGPSGVGKTTCARIVAKQINLKFIENINNIKNYELDIFEINAASNNSIDDIRNIIEQINITPKIGKYKIYIIDEVHMLSQAAFNAFLKTLEEPPLHVKFILATTQKHKIPYTILSRCQIYDFHRISIKDIKYILKKIALQEKINIDNESLFIISQKANGSLRNAISIFDQIILLDKTSITKKDVIQKLGLLDDKYYFNIINNIINNNINNILIILDQILQFGIDIELFISGLTDHIRNLLISKNIASHILLEVDSNIKNKYLLQSEKLTYKFLYKILKICNNTQIEYQYTINKRLYIEIFLIEIYNIYNNYYNK